MLLIETFSNGSLKKQHWHAVCKTKEESDSKIASMVEMFGSEYQHSAREVTTEDISELKISRFEPKKEIKPRRWDWDYEGGLPE